MLGGELRVGVIESVSQVLGWELGVIESVSITVLVGLSVDYVAPRVEYIEHTSLRVEH